MKVKTIIKTGQLFMMAVLLAACASEDVAQDKKKENGTEAPKGGVIFAANEPKASAKRLSIDGEEETADAKTRTILKHTPGQGADAYWKSDDFIWVKDKNGTWQKSTAITLHDGGASAEFTLPGSKADYLDGCEVRYTGHGSSAFYATPESATSVGLYKHYDFPTANDYTWAGHIGDCGSGKANNTGNPDKFNFTLAHKPAYLCFLPRCENAALAPNIRLTHIRLTATRRYNAPISPMVALFDFDGETIGPGTQGGLGSNVIDMDISDFPLTTAANPEANATYAIVRPDKYDFKIEYTIKDPTTRNFTVVTDIKTGITLDKGIIYDVTADLTPPQFPIPVPPRTPTNYYMWGAKNHYWYGYTIPGPGGGGVYYPGGPGVGNQMNDRYFDNGGTGTPTNPARYDAKADAFSGMQGIPNANELCWYVAKGDPHWVKGVFTHNGHLVLIYGGMWLRKKSAIVTYLKAHEGYPSTLTWNELKEGFRETITAAPIDARAKLYRCYNYLVSYGLPSNLSDYFFLPASGYFDSGTMKAYGSYGLYWSSSASPQSTNQACYMSIKNDFVETWAGFRYNGYSVQPFE